jgi:hypothetical protein
VKRAWFGPAVVSVKGLLLATFTYPAVRLVLVRGGLFCTSDGRRRFARRLDPGFALCPAELGFARQLLGVQTRYWLFRAHQQQAAGDFIAVDRSGGAASGRWFAIELKQAQRLRLGRPGMQLARSGQAVAWVAARHGLAIARLTEVVGDAASVMALLRGEPRVTLPSTPPRS